jgi:indole-3-glycerol phosphate synthase
VRAVAAGAQLLGINNRNLRTFETNLAVTAELLPLVPSSVVAISESGVRSRADVAPLYAAGARAFLIGESLMRSADKTELIRTLRGAGVPA